MLFMFDIATLILLYCFISRNIIVDYEVAY